MDPEKRINTETFLGSLYHIAKILSIDELETIIDIVTREVCKRLIADINGDIAIKYGSNRIAKTNGA